jgi:hypothetical protein
MSETEKKIDELIQLVEKVDERLGKMETIIELIENQLKIPSKP